MYYLALPLMIIWVGIYPFGLMIYLYRHRNQLNDLGLRKKVGFIYNGYNSNVYFW